MKALVVHSHFHRRRSGATTHIEAVVPTLGKTLDVRTIGGQLSAALADISVLQLLREQRQIVWHAHRVNELIWGLLFRLLRQKTRLVFTRHHGGQPSLFTRLFVSRADVVVALTSEVAAALPMPASVIGHGIDLQQFQPPADRAACWKALGCGGFYGIGVVGRVRPSKGSGDFAQAIAPLLQADEHWRAVFVGLVLPRFSRQARAWQTLGGERLLLVGEQKDIAAWYRGFTIVVQPSYAEGFGLVVLEAMASGCCVIAAHLSHYEQFITHGKTGFFYPSGDIGALRALLGSLMAQPELAQATGRAAAQAARNFGVEREAAALVEIYEKLAGD